MSSSILVYMFWPPLLPTLLLLCRRGRRRRNYCCCCYCCCCCCCCCSCCCCAVTRSCVRSTKKKTQSVVTGCAPRCIAGREAAAAQQRSSSSSGDGGGGTAAAAASSPSESRAGCCVVSPLPSVCVLYPGCLSLPWLRGFGLGIKLGACRPIVWTAGAPMNPERSSVQIVHLGSSGPFLVNFVQFSSFGWIFLVNLGLKYYIANTLIMGNVLARVYRVIRDLRRPKN